MAQEIAGETALNVRTEPSFSGMMNGEDVCHYIPNWIGIPDVSAIFLSGSSQGMGADPVSALFHRDP